MKDCTNPDCDFEIGDTTPFCSECGEKQVEVKKVKKVMKEEKVKKRLFGKKKEEVINIEVVSPKAFEDVKTILPKLLKKPAESITMETLLRMENKIDIIHSNYKWLLMNVKNWLEGHEEFKEPPDTIDDKDNENNENNK